MKKTNRHIRAPIHENISLSQNQYSNRNGNEPQTQINTKNESKQNSSNNSSNPSTPIKSKSNVNSTIEPIKKIGNRKNQKTDENTSGLNHSKTIKNPIIPKISPPSPPQEHQINRQFVKKNSQSISDSSSESSQIHSPPKNNKQKSDIPSLPKVEQKRKTKSKTHTKIKKDKPPTANSGIQNESINTQNQHQIHDKKPKRSNVIDTELSDLIQSQNDDFILAMFQYSDDLINDHEINVRTQKRKPDYNTNQTGHSINNDRDDIDSLHEEKTEKRVKRIHKPKSIPNNNSNQTRHSINDVFDDINSLSEEKTEKHIKRKQQRKSIPNDNANQARHSINDNHDDIDSLSEEKTEKCVKRIHKQRPKPNNNSNQTKHSINDDRDDINSLHEEKPKKYVKRRLQHVPISNDNSNQTKHSINDDRDDINSLHEEKIEKHIKRRRQHVPISNDNSNQTKHSINDDRDDINSLHEEKIEKHVKRIHKRKSIPNNNSNQTKHSINDDIDDIDSLFDISIHNHGINNQKLTPIQNNNPNQTKYSMIKKIKTEYSSDDFIEGSNIKQQQQPTLTPIDISNQLKNSMINELTSDYLYFDSYNDSYDDLHNNHGTKGHSHKLMPNSNPHQTMHLFLNDLDDINSSYEIKTNRNDHSNQPRNSRYKDSYDIICNNHGISFRTPTPIPSEDGDQTSHLFLGEYDEYDDILPDLLPGSHPIITAPIRSINDLNNGPFQIEDLMIPNFNLHEIFIPSDYDDVGENNINVLNDDELKCLLNEYEISESDIKDELCCSICLCDYGLGEKTVKLRCGHVFHENCILEWINKKRFSPSCPICRQKLKK